MLSRKEDSRLTKIKKFRWKLRASSDLKLFMGLGLLSPWLLCCVYWIQFRFARIDPTASVTCVCPLSVLLRPQWDDMLGIRLKVTTVTVNVYHVICLPSIWSTYRYVDIWLCTNSDVPKRYPGSERNRKDLGYNSGCEYSMGTIKEDILSSSNQSIIYNTKYITSQFTLLSIIKHLVYFITGIFHSHLISFLHIWHCESVVNFGTNYSFSGKEQPTTKINYHYQSASLLKHSPSIIIEKTSLPADTQQQSDASLCLSITGPISW